MAPSKRSRTADDSVEILESASSTFRRNTQKRPRLSVLDSSDGEDTPDLLMRDEEGEYTATQVRLGGNRENYERERDQVSEHEEDEIEAAVERATQDIRRHKESQQENQAADAGVIESITCINFMCHTRLHIALGPLINFIIGHNGSGKSAVLTALTLCLGGKATATNRGQSLKSFVKMGEENATLIVKIKNRGDQGYRQDIYGNSIIVERHFSIHGQSSFKIKNSEGKIISTKRHELDEITDFYALQLDNPINVLTQDMARQFLNNSTEADKYRFFVKGVQLEQLDNDYILMSESLDNNDTFAEYLEDREKTAEKEFDDANHKFELSQRQSSLRDRIANLSRQMAWAQVEEQEHDLAQMNREIEQEKAKVEQRLQSENDAADQFETAHRHMQDGDKLLEELKASLEPIKEKQDEAKESCDANDKEIAELQASQRAVHGSLSSNKKQVERFQREIEEEKQRLEAADGGAHAVKLSEIEEAERRIPEEKENFERHQAALPALERSSAAAECKVNDIRAAVTRKRGEVEQAERNLEDLQNQRPDPFAPYYPSIRNVMKAINAERNFHQKPIGPLGQHVKLLKPEWSSILETYIGPILNSFVVVDIHDSKLLGEIIKRCQYHCVVYIGKAAYMDTTPNEPDASFDTIMRVLEIENSLVRNQLILNQHIDKVILIKDRREGHRVMFGGPVPHNVGSCLCHHDNVRGAGFKLSHAMGGGHKSDPIKPYVRQRRMHTDIEAQIIIQRDNCLSLRHELNNLEAEKRDFEAEKVRCDQAVKRHGNDAKTLRVAIQRAEDEVTRLNQELEAAKPELGKLDSLKEELKKMEVEVVYYQGQFDESVEQKDKLDEDKRRLLELRDAFDAQAGQIARNIEKGKSRLAKLTDARQRALVAKNQAINERQTSERTVVELEGNRNELVENVKSFEQQASIIGERTAVDRGETTTSLDEKLNKLYQRIRDFEREIGGNSEEISRTRNQKKAELDSVKQQKIVSEKTSATLKLALSNRYLRWKRFRSDISTRARAGFGYLLSERAFKGRMLLDHKKKLLQLLVQPDSTHRGDEARQTRTLSGGEKSFSTICLLLALWDAMGSPIRCLDEFDVFMDSVNRDVSMKMMIAAARGSVGRQFILITPQAMGSAGAWEDVKIIRMNDPERGQTALPFVAQ